MTEIATIDWFGGGGHQFSLKTLLYYVIEIHDFVSECAAIPKWPEFSLTPNLEYFTPNFLSLTPTFVKVTTEKYSKTPTFSGRQHFYSYFQNPSENSEWPLLTSRGHWN